MLGQTSAFVLLLVASRTVSAPNEWLVFVAWVRGNTGEICVDNTSERVGHEPNSIFLFLVGDTQTRPVCVHLNAIATGLNITSMSFVSFNNLPNPSTNVLAIKQQQPPPLVDLDVLQAASRVLQEQLLKDAQIIPDHGEMFAYSVYLDLRLV